MRRRARSGRVFALALCLCGCAGGNQRAAHASALEDVPQSPRRADALAFGEVHVSSAAQRLAADCEHTTYEECNALDDDCNGVIDDECGYEGGAVQITVGWNSGADVDLYVTDPSGATLYYNEQHKRSRIGGHLDHDARGDCRREQQNPRIENAYWPPPARAGTYKVELQYFSPCAQNAATEATLSAVVGGQLVGSYRIRLEPEQRVEALSFVKR